MSALFGLDRDSSTCALSQSLIPVLETDKHMAWILRLTNEMHHNISVVMFIGFTGAKLAITL